MAEQRERPPVAREADDDAASELVSTRMLSLTIGHLQDALVEAADAAAVIASVGDSFDLAGVTVSLLTAVGNVHDAAERLPESVGAAA